MDQENQGKKKPSAWVVWFRHECFPSIIRSFVVITPEREQARIDAERFMAANFWIWVLTEPAIRQSVADAWNEQMERRRAA